jgi:hypothetical protein
MKAYGAKVLALAVAFIMFIQPAAAFTEMTAPFVTTDSTVFVEPFEFADLTITEFNQTNFAEDHIGSLDISSPAPAGNATSDHIVPDHGEVSGPVSPVLPSMKQSMADNFAYDRTYIFIDRLG